MIARVRRHRRAEALLREIGEPGSAGPHGGSIPYLIAGTAGAASPLPGTPDRSVGLRHLGEWLTDPLARLQPDEPRRPVWHCTVQAHPADPGLSDQQWAVVAADVMDRTGLAPAGDTRAVRWVAARHGGDHIHVIATLGRQDGTRPAGGGNIAGARNACHAAEDRYGLRSTRLTGKAGTAGACALSRE